MEIFVCTTCWNEFKMLDPAVRGEYGENKIYEYRDR